MTPEQQAYRDMWLRELWPTVPEWHQTKDERNDARERNDLLTPCAVTSDRSDAPSSRATPWVDGRPLWEPNKGRSTHRVTSVNGSCFVPRLCRSEQTFDEGARNRRSMPEHECARGGQTPGAAPLVPLEQEWHVP